MNRHHSKSDRLKNEAKFIRQLSQEYRELCRKAEDTPILELEKPFQRGYQRFFQPTAAAEKREDVEDLRFALAFFQNHQYCRKGLFRDGVRRAPKGPWQKGEVGYHQLRKRTFGAILKLGFPSQLCSFIRVKGVDLTHGIPPKQKLKGWQGSRQVHFTARSLIESRTRPYWVTHIKEIDPVIEARIRKIDQILWGNKHHGAVTKALHLKNYRRYSFMRFPLIERRFRKDAKQQLNEVNSDPTIKSAVSPRFFYNPSIVIFPLLPKLPQKPPQRSTTPCDFDILHSTFDALPPHTPIS